MSQTTLISVANNSGVRTPSHAQLNVTAGNEVTFHATDAECTLYFSPDLSHILTPEPGASASLSPGKDLTFTFADAEAGSYEIVFQAPELDPPTHFSSGATSLIFLKSGGQEIIPVEPPPPPPPPAPFPGVTTNPIQTLQANEGTLGVTSNPIQT